MPTPPAAPAPARTGLPRRDRHDGRYGRIAIALHWLLALMILSSLCVGVAMVGLPFSPARVRLFNWHKWAGIAILALSALRLLWRLAHRPPPLPEAVLRAMPGWQRAAHQGTIALMYALFFAVPLLGWAYSSASGFPVVWFGVLPLPDLVAPDHALAESLLKPLHATLAFSLATLAALHVAAALKHHFIDHDPLLARMWPRGRGDRPGDPPP